MFSTSPQINHSITSSTPLFSLLSSSSRKPSSPHFIAKMLLSSSHKRSTSSPSNSSTYSSSSSGESTFPFLPTIHSPEVSPSKKDQRDRDIKRARRSGGVFGAEDLKRSEEMFWEGAAKEMGF
jgi:hypothetical protein